MALYFWEQKFIVDMRLVSQVKEGQYIYQITNQSADTIGLHWDSALSPQFLEQTKEIIFLESYETREIRFTSEAEPMIRSGPLTFLHPEILVKLGAALVPALVPSQ